MKVKLIGGLRRTEHSKETTEEDKKRHLWGSIDNFNSFWLTQPSLCNLMINIGFTSFYECHVPAGSSHLIDRKTYVAIKGKAVKLLSSPVTDQASHIQIPEHQPIDCHSVQKQHNLLFKLAKQTFPQPIKNVIKFTLRALGLMKPEGTPKYLKEYFKEKKNRMQNK